MWGWLGDSIWSFVTAPFRSYTQSWRKFAKTVNERLETTEGRLDRCERRHKIRDKREKAILRELELLRDTHSMMANVEKYSHESTHRILNAMTPMSNAVQALCIAQGIPMQKADVPYPEELRK